MGHHCDLVIKQMQKCALTTKAPAFQPGISLNEEFNERSKIFSRSLVGCSREVN